MHFSFHRNGHYLEIVKAQRRYDKLNINIPKNVINIPNAPRDQLPHKDSILKLKASSSLDKKSNESFIMPACSNTTKDLSSVLMGSMDLVKANKYKNACYWKT